MPYPVKIKAVVDRVVSHGDGIYEVEFSSDMKFPGFKPGQFLHLAIDEYEPAGGFWPESRVFSIASRPGSDTLAIVYSVKGRYTKRMESYLAAEKAVWLKYPYGEFIIDSSIQRDQDVVMIAGGTGISPFLPYLAGISQDGCVHGRSLRVYYGVRKPLHVLFAGFLDRCSGIEGLRVCIFVENGDPVQVPTKNTQVRAGMLDIDLIYADAGNLRSPVFFLSGPPAMIQAFRGKLETLGVAGARIKVDEWE
jgi:NAD(P)H-flavin reductase